MTKAFLEALEEMLVSEGLYSHHKLDRGGATKYGVTEAVARVNGYKGDMRDLPLTFAREIYWKDYWARLKLDRVASSSKRAAFELFDTAVNTGVKVAGTHLQRCLNALGGGPLVADGVVGERTLAALEALRAKRGAEGMRVLFAALNCLQGERYVSIAERDPSQLAFSYGWLRARVADQMTRGED